MRSLSLWTFFICLVSMVQGDLNQALWPQAVNYGTPVASSVLIENQVLANSYNKPIVVQYTPPSTSFNRVTLDLEVNTTNGNYDRLGMAQLNGVEIWRTSTSEPANDDTYWGYTKDVSHYLELFKTPGPFQFLINNVIEGNLQGTFTVTLTVNFYQSSTGPVTDDAWAFSLDSPADKIWSVKKEASALYWSFPSDTLDVNLDQLSPSVNRALIQIFATGSGDDEFWWDKTVTGSNSAGPSRFIDIYLDDELAGFITPFPTIYAGGVSPYLWKPVVDIRAYDIPGGLVDITPFLPKLWAGSANLKIKVTNGIDGSAIPSAWIVNVNMFTWSDNSQTNSGSMNPPNIQPGQGTKTAKSVSVNRVIQNSATLTIGGKSQTATWTQNVTYSNVASIQSNGATWIDQQCNGQDSITGLDGFARSFNFPLQVSLGTSSFRVQSTYQVQSPVSVYSWVDTSAQIDGDGRMISANAAQYLSGPLGQHYLQAVNGHLTKVM